MTHDIQVRDEGGWDQGAHGGSVRSGGIIDFKVELTGSVDRWHMKERKEPRMTLRKEPSNWKNGATTKALGRIQLGDNQRAGTSMAPGSKDK